MTATGPARPRPQSLGDRPPADFDCDYQTFQTRQRARHAGWGPLIDADIEFVCLHVVTVYGTELLSLAEGDRDGFWRPIRARSGGVSGTFDGHGRVNVEVHGETITAEIGTRHGTVPWTRMADVWAERITLRPDLVQRLRSALHARGRYLHQHGTVYPGGYPWPADRDHPTPDEHARLVDWHAWQQRRHAIDRDITRAIRALADVQPPRQTALF